MWPSGQNWLVIQGPATRDTEPKSRRPAASPLPETASAVRALLEEEAKAAGSTLANWLATLRRGRIPAADRPSYDALALAVYRMRTRGRCSLAVVGVAIERDAKAALRLEKRGRRVEWTNLGTPAPSARSDLQTCRRHTSHKVDCPACRRVAGSIVDEASRLNATPGPTSLPSRGEVISKPSSD